MDYGLLTRRTGEAAVMGGCVLGGGGGGAPAMGRELVELAVQAGRPHLVPLDDLDPKQPVLTVALVGAPAAQEALLKPVDLVRAVELAIEALDLDQRELGGLITNENGAVATVNGWFQAAILDVPVVDAPCNGRAHPTGLMGAMGLQDRVDYTTVQTGAGGSVEDGRYVEIVVRGNLEHCARLIRLAAVEAGGLVGVARNPVEAGWAGDNGAPGAVGQAIDLGTAMLDAGGDSLQVARRAAAFLGGELVATGTVTGLQLETRGGFDVGLVTVEQPGQKPIELTFWNEFMTCERAGRRLATFPDLIGLFDLSRGEPLTTAEVKKDMSVALLLVDRGKLRLGAGMRSDKLMRQAEEAVGKRMVLGG